MWNKDCEYIFERYYINSILIESKQSLINLGYPKVLVDLLFERYGKNSFIVAKWLKESLDYKIYDKSSKDWWVSAFRELSIFTKKLDLVDYVKLYNAARMGVEEYIKVREEVEDPISEENIRTLDIDQKVYYYHEKIREKLFDNNIFHTSIIKGLDSNKIRNIKEYTGLSFNEANDKYNKKRVFEDSVPIKSYKDGYRWIDVGRKCELVGSLMKNCGSTGVMSMDEDKTMLVLFDGNNIPHVVLTYSPNEKRVSGIEGQASTASKEEYHDYVLDIARYLGADIDYERESSKSKMLAIRSMLKEKLKSIDKVYVDEYNQYFLVKMDDGSEYYTDYNNFVPKEKIKSNKVKDIKEELKDISLQAYRGKETPAIHKSDFLSKYNIKMYSPKY